MRARKFNTKTNGIQNTNKLCDDDDDDYRENTHDRIEYMQPNNTEA